MPDNLFTQLLTKAQALTPSALRVPQTGARKGRQLGRRHPGSGAYSSTPRGAELVRPPAAPVWSPDPVRKLFPRVLDTTAYDTAYPMPRVVGSRGFRDRREIGAAKGQVALFGEFPENRPLTLEEQQIQLGTRVARQNIRTPAQLDKILNPPAPTPPASNLVDRRDEMPPLMNPPTTTPLFTQLLATAQALTPAALRVPQTGANPLVETAIDADIWINERLGGRTGETISARAGRGGMPGARVVSGALDLVDPGHTTRAVASYWSNRIPFVPLDIQRELGKNCKRVRRSP